MQKGSPPSLTRKICILFTFLLSSGFLSSCFRKPRPRAGTNTGFTVLQNFDKTRKFDTTGDEKAPFYYRPVKIDIFYPSPEKPSNPALSFGELLDQYELRMNYNTPPDSCRKTSLGIAGMIADYLHAENALKLLDYPLDIYKGLAFPSQKSPLIIYAASMNGSSWENPILFDSLAKRGYVVAALSSVGKYPGFMSEAVDIDEQVKDILYTKEVMGKLPFIDTARIGLLSWSLGGTAITKAAMLSKDFKALLSCDGTEIHYYGFDTAWDRQYRQIAQYPPVFPERITAPYLYLSSEHPKKVDSIYLFPQHIGSEHKYFLQMNKSIHEDFSSIVSIAKAVTPGLEDVDSIRHALVCGLAGTFFDQYLGGNEQDEFLSRTTGDYINRLMAERASSFDTSYPRK